MPAQRVPRSRHVFPQWHQRLCKVLITEKLTFDIHAASRSNLFWELWRDLPEDEVDGLKVDYDVNYVKEIKNYPTLMERYEYAHQTLVDKCTNGNQIIFSFPQSDYLGKNYEPSLDVENITNLKPTYLTLQKLKDMLKYAPTGRNVHKLHFSTIENIEVMEDFKKLTYKKVKKLLASPCGNLISKKFNRYKKAIENGKDILFRGAPHLIVVSAPQEESCAEQDGIIALSYLELYAQSLGVGTVWCGLVQYCLKAFPELCEYLGIPKDNRPIYVMLFGPTDLKYTRTVQPNEYKINSIKEKQHIPKISLIKKIKRFIFNNK